MHFSERPSLVKTMNKIRIVVNEIGHIYILSYVIDKYMKISILLMEKVNLCCGPVHLLKWAGLFIQWNWARWLFIPIPKQLGVGSSECCRWTDVYQC